MKTKLENVSLAEIKCDVLILNLFEGVKVPTENWERSLSSTPLGSVPPREWQWSDWGKKRSLVWMRCGSLQLQQ